MPEPDDYGCKVRDLLPERFDDLDKVVADELSGPEGGKASLPALAMKVAGDKVAESVKGVLDCDLFETLAQAWVKARELHEYKDPKKHPPGERSTVFLGEHPLTNKLPLVIEVKVAGLGQGRLRFVLELKAKFRCADLTIQDGRIVEIGAGDCHATAQLKYRDTNLHKALKSRHVVLSRPRVLAAPGLAIL